MNPYFDGVTLRITLICWAKTDTRSFATIVVGVVETVNIEAASDDRTEGPIINVVAPTVQAKDDGYFKFSSRVGDIEHINLLLLFPL